MHYYLKTYYVKVQYLTLNCETVTNGQLVLLIHSEHQSRPLQVLVRVPHQM